MLAKERHPQPPQRVGAGQHHFHLPAGMRAGMVGERQLQHVLEIIRQHHVAALMREPVGEPGHQRAGDNDEQAEADPGADQRRQRPRRRRRAPAGSAPDKRVDDAAEQHRLDELRAASAILASASDHGEPRVGAQKAEHAKIDTDKGHDAVLSRGNGGRRLDASSGRDPGCAQSHGIVA